MCAGRSEARCRIGRRLESGHKEVPDESRLPNMLGCSMSAKQQWQTRERSPTQWCASVVLVRSQTCAVWVPHHAARYETDLRTQRRHTGPCVTTPESTCARPIPPLWCTVPCNQNHIMSWPHARPSHTGGHTGAPPQLYAHGPMHLTVCDPCPYHGTVRFLLGCRNSWLFV